MSGQGLFRAAEAGGAEQREKYDGKATRKQERCPGGLDGGRGGGVGSFSQLSPLACLSIQPGPMFRDTNDTERLGTAERGR